MDPVDTAHAVVEEHHPDARAAFLGGSVPLRAMSKLRFPCPSGL